MNSTYAVELTREIRERSLVSSIATNAGLIVAGTLLLTLLAQIEVPMFPVPITGQSLGVLLIGAALGSSRSMASVIAYLGIGALGAPVFAGGGLGLATFFGPTGGFLLSFVPAAGLVGYLCERGWDRKFFSALIVFTFGHAVIFAIGVSWLAAMLGWEEAVAVGFIPFIPGMLIKTAIATALLPLLWEYSPVRRETK